jgi:uncharacterized protein (DUF736 family)
MMIGKFNQQGDLYTGSIYGLGFNVPYVVFSPVPAKQGNSSPDFVVLGALSEEDGGEFEIGAAWKKTSKKGKAYLSVKLDGPTLAAPINCALTTQLDGSQALIWSRDSRKDDDEQAAA